MSNTMITVIMNAQIVQKDDARMWLLLFKSVAWINLLLVNI